MGVSGVMPGKNERPLIPCCTKYPPAPLNLPNSNADPSGSGIPGYDLHSLQQGIATATWYSGPVGLNLSKILVLKPLSTTKGSELIGSSCSSYRKLQYQRSSLYGSQPPRSSGGHTSVTYDHKNIHMQHFTRAISGVLSTISAKSIPEAHLAPPIAYRLCQWEEFHARFFLQGSLLPDFSLAIGLLLA